MIVSAAVCIPGYEDWKPEGYTFEEIVVSLREATKVLQGLSTNGSAKWIGVFHDWGCNRQHTSQPLVRRKQRTSTTRWRQLDIFQISIF